MAGKIISAITPEEALSTITEELEKKINEIDEYIKLGRTGEAVKYAEKLVDENISSPMAWYVLGMTKQTWEDFDGAIKAYEQVIAMSPTAHGPYGKLSEIYGDEKYSGNSVEKQREILNKGLKACPDSSYLQDMLIWTTEDGEAAKALEMCEKFLQNTDNKELIESDYGCVHIALADELIVEIGSGDDAYYGFISEKDIEKARKLVGKGRPLVNSQSPIADFSYERADEIIKLCDEDSKSVRISKSAFLFIHSLIIILFYGILSAFTNGIFLPVLVIALIANIKGNYSPAYALNYAYSIGCDNPLIYYKHEKLIERKGSIPQEQIALDVAKFSSNGSVFHAAVQNFKLRVHFYKSIIRKITKK